MKRAPAHATFAGTTSLRIALGLLVVVVLLCTLSACDSMLEENPESFVSPTNFYRNEEDALAAINGVYRSLSPGAGLGIDSRDAYFMLVLPTAMATTSNGPSGARGQWDVYGWDASNNYPRQLWRTNYVGINRANLVIQRVPEISDMDPELRSRIVAEARFIRALHYFYLVRLWGGVPLRRAPTTTSESEIPAAPADSIFAFIIDDLTRAQRDLPLKSAYAEADKPRASLGAAQALLAKVYLQRGAGGVVAAEPQSGDFQNAADLLSEVISSGEYALVEDYGSLWDENNEESAEHIFVIEHSFEAPLGSILQNFLAPSGSNFGTGQWTSAQGELPFYQSYQEGDVRQEASWLTEFEDAEGVVHTFNADDVKGDNYIPDGPTFNKLIIKRSDIGFAEGGRDFFLLRYADVLLLYAEALYVVSAGPTAEAYDAVNEVRSRAGLPDLTAGLDYETFKDSLFFERRWELAQEGHGWFQGQRFWERFKRVVEANADLADPAFNTVPVIDFEVTDKFRVFPIPQDVLDRNPALEQNEGW